MSQYVKPVTDKTIVRMPEKNNTIMPTYGSPVPNSTYWHRRLKDGDVVKISEADFNKAKEVVEAKAKKEWQEAEAQKKADVSKSETTANTNK